MARTLHAAQEQQRDPHGRGSRGARYYALTLEERIALVIKNNPLSKRSDIAAVTGLDLQVVGRKLNTLCREKKIRMRGDRRGARYVSC